VKKRNRRTDEKERVGRSDEEEEKLQEKGDGKDGGGEH
jgi:hypothetical protein